MKSSNKYNLIVCFQVGPRNHTLGTSWKMFQTSLLTLVDPLVLKGIQGIEYSQVEEAQDSSNAWNETHEHGLGSKNVFLI